MRHPNEGVLRRLVDEPVSVTATEQAHVDGCSRCRHNLATVRADAEQVSAALSADVVIDTDADTGGAATDADAAVGIAIEAGWQRLLSTATSGGSGSTHHRPVGGRPARARRRRRPALAAGAVALVLVGAGAAAANDWLPIFQTETIAPIAIDPADLNTLPDLRAYGDFVITGRPGIHPVADAAAAEAEAGFEAPEPTSLPDGIHGRPTHYAGDELSATFTFSTERAGAAAEAAGESLPPVPDGLDGSKVKFVAGPGIAAIWSSQASVPALIVARVVAPTASSSSSVPFETMRDYMLSLPGVPDDVAASLRTFNAENALPLPVPTTRFDTSSASIHGRPGTVLATKDGLLTAVVWVRDGKVNLVAGPLEADEVVDVARGLR